MDNFNNSYCAEKIDQMQSHPLISRASQIEFFNLIRPKAQFDFPQHQAQHFQNNHPHLYAVHQQY